VKDNYLVSGLHHIVFVWFIFIFEKIYVNTLVTVLIEPDGPLALYAATTKFMGEKILKFPGQIAIHVILCIP
jgi:hypothetical protein